MTLEGRLETAVSTDATGPDAVEFEFTVTNAGSSPVELSFPNSGKAEFVVEDEGREVWRFTEGRMFAQVISSEELDPGEEATYEGTWSDPQSGEFTVVAELRARNATCQARSDVSV